MNRNLQIMQFRSLTVADAELLFHWKNDPVTRVNSSSTAEIPWEEHFKWVLSVILDPNEEIIRMAIFDQVPVGIVRIALRDDEQVEVYYTVSPVWRRQGIGTKMVVDFVSTLSTRLSPVSVSMATSVQAAPWAK